MKRSRTFIIILSAALLMLSMAFSASAEGFAPSLKLLPEATDDTVSLYSRLGDLQTEYFSYPSGSGASLAISPYRDALNLSLPIEEAQLIYYRGVVAAYLAFLYNGNEAVGELYRSLAAQIDGDFSDHTELYAAATAKKTGGGIAARLLAAIYEDKLSALAVDGDSEAVRAIVSAAITRVNNVPAGKLPYEKAEYELILRETRAAIEIRKMQELAKSELTAAFELIFPGGKPEDHECMANALALIDLDTGESDSAEKINAHMKEALARLVGELSNGKKYNSLYIEKKLAELDALPSSGQIAAVSRLFLSHGVDLERAASKDGIADEIFRREYKNDEKMTELEAEYNAGGGTLDGCVTPAELALERKKASRRIELYGEMLEAKRKISEYLSETPLISEADAAARAGDIAIRAASAATLDGKYENAIEELLALVNLAEAGRFELDNKEIFEKEDISSADRALILDAMSDAAALSGNARELLAGKFDELAEKYRAATLERLGEALGSRTDLRARQKSRLAEALVALTVADDPDNFPEFIESADEQVARAEASDKLFSRYEAIVGESHYRGFANGDKNSLKKITEAAADELASAGASVLEASLLKLDRAEAAARIDAARHRREDIDEAAFAEIEKAAAEAKEKIELSRNAAEIRTIADAAVRSIEGAFSASDGRKAEKDAKTVAELTPIIIILSVTLFLELCAIAVMIFLLRRRKRLALLSFFTPVTAGATVAALTLMNAAAIGVIIYLAVKLAFGMRPTPPSEPDEEIYDRSEEEPKEEPEKTEETEETEEAEEATEEEPPAEEPFDSEKSRARRRAEINLDVIERNFDPWETVTLDELKERRLIPRRADAVKVLGRGGLEKPLTVLAQDFSETAETAIISAGGEAVHI